MVCFFSVIPLRILLSSLVVHAARREKALRRLVSFLVVVGHALAACSLRRYSWHQRSFFFILISCICFDYLWIVEPLAWWDMQLDKSSFSLHLKATCAHTLHHLFSLVSAHRRGILNLAVKVWRGFPKFSLLLPLEIVARSHTWVADELIQSFAGVFLLSRYSDISYQVGFDRLELFFPLQHARRHELIIPSIWQPSISSHDLRAGELLLVLKILLILHSW